MRSRINHEYILNNKLTIDGLSNHINNHVNSERSKRSTEENEKSL